MNPKKFKNTSPRVKIIQKIYGSLMNPDEAITYPKNQYKKYKIKQWNVGREIVQYDKNYYDSQRENLIPDDEIEVLLENIEEPNMDNRLGELDAIDIDHFGPEYYDGDFYGESNMEDEFEET